MGYLNDGEADSGRASNREKGFFQEIYRPILLPQLNQEIEAQRILLLLKYYKDILLRKLAGNWRHRSIISIKL